MAMATQVHKLLSNTDKINSEVSDKLLVDRTYYCELLGIMFQRFFKFYFVSEI